MTEKECLARRSQKPLQMYEHDALDCSGDPVGSRLRSDYSAKVVMLKGRIAWARRCVEPRAMLMAHSLNSFISTHLLQHRPRVQSPGSQSSPSWRQLPWLALSLFGVLSLSGEIRGGAGCVMHSKRNSQTQRLRITWHGRQVFGKPEVSVQLKLGFMWASQR